MLLNRDTIKFFCLDRAGSLLFPLYIESIRFFSHRDQMVRTAVRTITLQVYRVEDEAMRRFVLRHAASSYAQLACHLRDLWVRLDADVSLAAGEADLSCA